MEVSQTTLFLYFSFLLLNLNQENFEIELSILLMSELSLFLHWPVKGPSEEILKRNGV